MIVNKALHRIQTGEATPKEARQTLRELLANRDPKASHALYPALRSWTWKALSTRRFDPEMTEWFELLQAVSVRLRKMDVQTSHYIAALSDLVDESLRFAPTRDIERLLTRSHVGDLLEIVRRNNGRVDRSRLESDSGLSTSRLSQLLTELTVLGALNREPDGRRAIFVLTDLGREIQTRWVEAQTRPRCVAELEATFRPRTAPQKTEDVDRHERLFVIQHALKTVFIEATELSAKRRQAVPVAVSTDAANDWSTMVFHNAVTAKVGKTSAPPSPVSTVFDEEMAAFSPYLTAFASEIEHA
jgi:predicted transcriptional regulator